MITIKYLELRRTIPKGEYDRRAMVREYKPGIYVWDGDAWVLKRYWTVEEVAEWIKVEVSQVEALIERYGKYLPKKRYSRRPKYDYANLLKIKFMLNLHKRGKLNEYLETDEINSLYDRPSKLECLPG